MGFFVSSALKSSDNFILEMSVNIGYKAFPSYRESLQTPEDKTVADCHSRFKEEEKIVIVSYVFFSPFAVFVEPKTFNSLRVTFASNSFAFNRAHIRSRH